MSESTPKLEDLAIKTIAMPKDANPFGDIFGGWTVSQMDLAGSFIARKYSKKRVATVSIQEIVFYTPIKIGDAVSCYAFLEKIGNTSLTIHVEVWISSLLTEDSQKAAKGTFTFVALDEDGKKSLVRK